MSEKIRNILKEVAGNPNLLQRLIREPRNVAKEFELDSAQTEQLVHSDILIAAGPNPLAEISAAAHTIGPFTIIGSPSTMETTTPITITVTAAHLEDREFPEPRKLEDLSHERLVEVTQRILVDPDYAARVRAFLKL